MSDLLHESDDQSSACNQLVRELNADGGSRDFLKSVGNLAKIGELLDEQGKLIMRLRDRAAAAESELTTIRKALRGS